MIQTSRTTTTIAGTGTNVGSSNVWTNPGNITADDGNNAFWGAMSGGETSDTLRATNFGLNVPSCAVIDGVLVTLGDLAQFSAYSSTIMLRTNAVNGEDKADGAALQSIYGGMADLWGMTLTPTIVNGSDFGVDIAAGDVSGGDASVGIDYVQIDVFWHYDVTVAAAEVPLRYDYKIYSPDGRFLGNLPNVISTFKTIQDINSAGSQLPIEVAGNIDGSTPDLALASLTRWLPGGWDYRIKVTIPKTAVTAELANCPVYINLADLGTQFFGNVNSAGADIRITDIYGVQELPLKVVSIDTSARTGELNYKAPLLSNEYDNVFYIYYGNPTASAYDATATYGAQNVWTGGYGSAYHLFYEVGNQQSETIEAVDALIKNGNLVNAYETSYYYPNGKLMYQGQINRIKAKFDPNVDGTIKITCHSDGRDLDNYIARGAPFTYTNDQTHQTGDSGFVVQDTGGPWERVGQTWMVGAAVTNIGRIQVALGGNATVTLAVYTDSSQATLLGSVTKNVNVAWATVVSFEFSEFITVTPGGTYFFALSVNSGQSIQVYYKSASNPYANGSMYTASFSGGSGGGSYAISTNNDLYFTTAYGVLSTQATFTSDDPSGDMLPAIIDDYSGRGGLIKRTTGSIDDSGLSLTMFFNTNTIYESISKIREVCPNGFYYYVDLGTNVLWFKQTSRTADFLLVKGRHVEALDLDFSIESVVNNLLFSGGDTGSGSNLYSQYLDATSDKMYGHRLDRKSDNRVTVQTTADAIGKTRIAELKGEQYYTTVTVPARSMDITLLKPGKTIGFRGYGSFIDSILLQATRVEYTPERAVLQIGTLPLRFSTSTEQISRGLIAQQTINNPSAPS